MTNQLSKREQERDRIKQVLEEYNLKFILSNVLKNIQPIKKMIYLAKHKAEHEFVYARIDISDAKDRIYSDFKIESMSTDKQLGSIDAAKNSIDPASSIVLILYRGNNTPSEICSLTPDKLEKIKLHLGNWSDIPVSNPSQISLTPINIPLMTIDDPIKQINSNIDNSGDEKEIKNL